MFEKLNKLFKERYNKLFASMNVNVYPCENIGNGIFNTPSVSIGQGGGNLISLEKEGDLLVPPALVTVSTKLKYGMSPVYRLNIPFNECSIAADKPEYFAYLFDNMLDTVIKNYNTTFGGVDKVRFGESYCLASLEVSEEADGNVILTLKGLFAGNKDVPSVTIPTEES